MQLILDGCHLLITISDINGVPGYRRERIEAAVVAGALTLGTRKSRARLQSAGLFRRPRTIRQVARDIRAS
jgi:hypothetical protein